MTKEEILAMKPGSIELDTAVHRDVMGKGEPSLIRSLPHYSSDISAAWPVVEKMKDYYLKIEFNQYSKKWEVDFGSKGVVSADSCPEAICKAALLALEGGEG